MKKDNAISRRESIALLASGLVSLHDLNNFNYNSISTTEKSLKKMNRAYKKWDCHENDRHHRRPRSASHGRP